MSLAHYDHFDWGAMLLSIAVTLACFGLEIACVGWQRSSIYKLTHQFKSVSNDFFATLLGLSHLSQLVGILFYGGVFYFLYGQVQKHVHFHFIALIDSVTLQFVIMLVISDFRDYIIHRIWHSWGWMWELHRFHHSAVDMTILTSYRSHAAEGVLTEFLSLIMFITLGVPAETYLAVTLFHQAHQRLTHSQIHSDWGWIGRYILVSPAAHRSHHSKDPLHYGKNFGIRFIFWDRLFGTYYRPDEQMEYEFGLPDNEFNQKGYLNDLFRSYFKAIRVAKESMLSLFNTRKEAVKPESEI